MLRFTKNRAVALAAMALTLFLAVQSPTHAQWATSSTNIYSTNTGNVGIGTQNPTFKFTVLGSVGFTGNLGVIGNTFLIGNLTFGTIGGPKGIFASSNDNNISLTASSTSSTTVAAGNLTLGAGSSASGPGGSVFINANSGSPNGNIILSQNGIGNVGVGTSNPLVKLQVNGGNIGQLSSGNFGEATGKWSALGQPPTAFPTGGAYYGTINNWSQQNFITGLLDNGVKKDGVIAWQDQTSTSTTVGTSLRIGFIKGFGTSGTNPAVFSEKVTILANGNVGVATTTPVYRIELPNIANVTGQGRANAWVTYSSGRWKDNVKTFEKASEIITAMRGVEFDWKKENGGNHAVGFIAEELGKVLPEAVTWEADGKNALGVNYDAVIPVLVQAFKEQVALNVAKDTLIGRLEKRLTALEKGSRLAVAGLPQEGAVSRAVLYQNRPNPFSGRTTIEFELPDNASQATVLVFNLNGAQVKRFSLRAAAGKGNVEVGSRELSAGMYLYSLVVDGQVIDTKRMILTE